MSNRIRIADRLVRQSAEQLVITAGSLISGLTNNPAFPAPTVDLNAVQAAADDLKAAAAATRDRSPLANPSILSIDRGNSDELILKITPVARAKCYEVRSAVAGNGNVAGAWQQAGLFTSSRISIANLVPTTTYVFQVRAIGAAGTTEWSDPVSHMCA